jgi:hypothetical protein
VLLVVDVLALHVLGVLEPGLLLGRDLAVGLRLRLELLDVLLATLELPGLAGGQRAGLNALVDPLLLAVLPAMRSVSESGRLCHGDGGHECAVRFDPHNDASYTALLT